MIIVENIAQQVSDIKIQYRDNIEKLDRIEKKLHDIIITHHQQSPIKRRKITGITIPSVGVYIKARLDDCSDVNLLVTNEYFMKNRYDFADYNVQIRFEDTQCAAIHLFWHVGLALWTAGFKRHKIYAGSHLIDYYRGSDLVGNNSE